MYQWYRNSGVCYVFLADVPTKWDVIQKSDGTFDPKGYFKKTRWFTRGWTLQELIAPRAVDFFSSDWLHLGTKFTFLSEISSITSIPEGILSGETYLSECSVAERMSWASTRKTTRTEDQSYSLLGIFGIHMPLIYGEGKNAFFRLQQEILNATGDLSLLAWDLWKPWTHPPGYTQTRERAEARDGYWFLCDPLAESPEQFRNGTEDGMVYSALQPRRSYTPPGNAGMLRTPPSATARGVSLRVPLKRFENSTTHTSDSLYWAFLGCDVSGAPLCICVDKNFRYSYRSREGDVARYCLASSNDLDGFQVDQAFLGVVEPLQPSPWNRTPEYPLLRGFSNRAPSCTVSLDVKELEHCSVWKNTRRLQPPPDDETVIPAQRHDVDTEAHIAINWVAADKRRMGGYVHEDQYIYTAYLMPCFTDFKDVFLLILNQYGAVLVPSSACDLLDVESESEAEAATIEDLARAASAAERELNKCPFQWGGGSYLDDRNYDILRFEHCAVSVACKQGNGGARIVLGSWGIMDSPSAQGTDVGNDC